MKVVKPWWLFLMPFVCIVNCFHTSKDNFKITVKWQEMLPGIWYAEIKNPYTSKISDNIINLIKVDPRKNDVNIYSALAIDSIKRTVKDWSNDFKLNFVVNAGMYSLKNTYQSEGYMRTNSFLVNPVIKENFKMFAVFNPRDSSIFPLFKLIDTENELTSIVDNYQSAFQSIRMIDCYGKRVTWKPRRLLYNSMVILATDNSNNLIVAFIRSPISANQMSDILIHSNLDITGAMYLEGGPEAAFYLSTPDTIITRNGSYVSYTFPTDTNTRYWELPNVIGVKNRYVNYP